MSSSSFYSAAKTLLVILFCCCNSCLLESWICLATDSINTTSDSGRLHTSPPTYQTNQRFKRRDNWINTVKQNSSWAWLSGCHCGWTCKDFVQTTSVIWYLRNTDKSFEHVAQGQWHDIQQPEISCAQYAVNEWSHRYFIVQFYVLHHLNPIFFTLHFSHLQLHLIVCHILSAHAIQCVWTKMQLIWVWHECLRVCVWPVTVCEKWHSTCLCFALNQDLPGRYDALSVTKLPPCVSCHQRDVHQPGLTSVLPAFLHCRHPPLCISSHFSLKGLNWMITGRLCYMSAQLCLPNPHLPCWRCHLAIFSISAGCALDGGDVIFKPQQQYFWGMYSSSTN